MKLELTSVHTENGILQIGTGVSLLGYLEHLGNVHPSHHITAYTLMHDFEVLVGTGPNPPSTIITDAETFDWTSPQFPKSLHRVSEASYVAWFENEKQQPLESEALESFFQTVYGQPTLKLFIAYMKILGNMNNVSLSCNEHWGRQSMPPFLSQG